VNIVSKFILGEIQFFLISNKEYVLVGSLILFKNRRKKIISIFKNLHLMKDSVFQITLPLHSQTHQFEDQ